MSLSVRLEGDVDNSRPPSPPRSSCDGYARAAAELVATLTGLLDRIGEMLQFPSPGPDARAVL